MATLLYRLGRFSYRRRRRMTAVWLLLLALFGLGAVTLSGPSVEGLSIPGAESSRALDVITDKMGGSGDNASANVVFTVGRDARLTGAGQREAIERAVVALRELPHVDGVTDPFGAGTVSSDKRTAFATVRYDLRSDDLPADTPDKLLDAGRTAQTGGITVEFSGDALGEGDEPLTEVIGVVVAAVVLMITFGSLVAAGLSLLTAALGVGMGILGIQVATGFADLTSNTSVLALMLGLAVGIDYALFIVSRYRGELAKGRDGEEAAGRAVGTAGSAVVFAGLTVIIALAALSVVGIPFLTSMGLAAAGTVAVAVLISLTLLPALLGFVGARILPRKRRTTPIHPHHARPAAGRRWARFVTRRRIPVLVAAVGLVLLAAIPALDLRLALPSDASASPASTQRKAYDQLADGFGAGFNGPLVIVVEAGAGAATDAAAQARTRLATLDDVVQVSAPAANDADDTALLTVVPRSGPADEATKDLVTAIRGQEAAFSADTGAMLAVTGTTAVGIDVSTTLADALVPYLAVVIGLALLLLLLVFRSIAVPIKAALGFLLSLGATFGATVAVFQWGWFADLIGLDTTGPIVSMIPIFLIGILFGLAMDYEVFLVTRAREEYVHGASPNDAVVAGVGHGARVVTAAAIIMISVFAGFILGDEPIIKSLGFALAFGVAVDAFLIRMTIVPAVLSLLGRAAWWLPRWLDRLLPDVDVDGAQLDVRTAADDEAPDRELADAPS
ncbi:MMPL family transporter [Cryptosporangium sp. NPDC051539]|uniref:MMPL family transporter n=1 Tax=Cryptosporangium sp. NPDC051539 TaxID=3363962 RepID=UPI0037A10DD2